MEMIREVNFSFSQASVASSRSRTKTTSTKGSFPAHHERSFLARPSRKFAINSDGTVGSVIWDTGSVLPGPERRRAEHQDAHRGSLREFTAWIPTSYFGITDTSLRDMIVGFFRGETAYNKENWKLGDVFRSNPVSIGTPSYHYIDNVDRSRPTCNAFCTFRNNQLRTSAPATG